MNEREQFRDGLGLLVTAYILVTLDFNFNLNAITIPLLPNILGWFCFYKAVLMLSEQCQELLLLKNFCLLLMVASLEQFIPTLMAHIPGKGYFDVVVILVTLYFHFQLLTNVSDLAVHHGISEYRETLLSLRIHTIFCQTLVCLWKLLPLDWVIILVLPLIYAIIVMLCIAYQLHQMQKALDSPLYPENTTDTLM